MRIIFTALLVSLFMLPLAGQLYGQLGNVTDKITIGNIGSSSNKDFTEDCFVYIDYISGYLYIVFRASIGETFISIASLNGYLTYTTTCIAAAETWVNVPLPQDIGQYMVIITYDGYQVFGLFAVE